MNHQRFYDSIGVLIRAYMRDKLIHRSAQDCAVGHLLKAVGVAPIGWVCAFYPRRNTRIPYPAHWISQADEMISHIPYTFSQVARIEQEFESCYPAIDADGFIGLSKVFDLLYSFEDWTGEEVKLVDLVEGIEYAD